MVRIGARAQVAVRERVPPDETQHTIAPHSSAAFPPLGLRLLPPIQAAGSKAASTTLRSASPLYQLSLVHLLTLLASCSTFPVSTPYPSLDTANRRLEVTKGLFDSCIFKGKKKSVTTPRACKVITHAVHFISHPPTSSRFTPPTPLGCTAPQPIPPFPVDTVPKPPSHQLQPLALSS